MTDEDIDKDDHLICYNRKKMLQRMQENPNLKPPMIKYGKKVGKVLKRRPAKGPLFPSLCKVRSGDRATEFKQRCMGLGIKGVTLHSYRYSWAERARKAHYPQRCAQENLGQNSAAVHRAYAKNAAVSRCIPTRRRHCAPSPPAHFSVRPSIAFQPRKLK